MKAYGAGGYTGNVPIGGVLKSPWKPEEATKVVSTSTQLYDALRNQQPSDVVYVEDDKALDITDWCGTSQSWRGPRIDCVLASNGGLIRNRRLLRFSAGRFNYQLHLYGKMAGIRLEGPDPEVNSGDNEWWTGVVVLGRGMAWNNEAMGWNYGAFVTHAELAQVTHNDIHHCQRQGMGYGVQMCAGFSLVEANKFDFCRHHITADRGPEVNFKARYNIFGANCTNTLADVHGDTDPGYTEWPKYSAGGEWEICFNDFLQAIRSSVGVRGKPAVMGKVYRNWTHHTAADYAFRQDGPHENMLVYENHYGLTPPPDLDPDPPPPEPPPHVCPPCERRHCVKEDCPILNRIWNVVEAPVM